jgi:PIN domain nuclease of toxin-antitoxin system
VRVLLDANAFLRFAANTLPRPTERLLTKSTTEKVISIVTAWEIVLKPKLGRTAANVEEGIKKMGAALLPIKFSHLDKLENLPFRDDHKDPFDRILIAQALAEDLYLVTSDARFSSYKSLKVLWD